MVLIVLVLLIGLVVLILRVVFIVLVFLWFLSFSWFFRECFDGDCWYILKGNKGKLTGVPSARASILAFTTPKQFLQTVWPKMLSVENGFAELVKKHEAQEARRFVTYTVDAAGRTSGYRLSCGLDIAAQPILAPYRDTTRTTRSRWPTRTTTISMTTTPSIRTTELSEPEN